MDERAELAVVQPLDRVRGVACQRRQLRGAHVLLCSETPLTNNDVLKKLRIAFELKDSDIVALVGKTGLRFSKAELGALFRRRDHSNFRKCGDQFLRKLLKAMLS